VSELVVHMSMSLDGFVAAEGDGPGRGLGVGGEPLHGWLAGGNDVDAAAYAEILATGAVITGRHTFEWAGSWGGDHHDGVPIHVLSRSGPDHPVPGNVHYTADLEAAAAQARAAAGEREVLVHGASSVQALLRAGLVDVFALALVPIVLGGGKRLFDEALPGSDRLRPAGCRPGKEVLHLRYDVVR
jgi:dihydrofolate reductase